MTYYTILQKLKLDKWNISFFVLSWSFVRLVNQSSFDETLFFDQALRKGQDSGRIDLTQYRFISLKCLNEQINLTSQYEGERKDILVECI